MKNFLSLLLCGGALLISNSPSEAKTCYLYSTANEHNQYGNPISRIPKHSLAIDVTNHVITVPSEVWSYSLTLISKEGNTYNYFLLSNKLFLSSSLEGEFKITILNFLK